MINYEDRMRTRLDLAMTSVDVDAFMPEDVEPIIVDLVRANSPLIANVGVRKANGKIHEYRRVTAVTAANFEGELAATVATRPTYSKVGKTLKIIRGGDGISHFAEAAADKRVDLFKDSIMHSAEQMTFAMEFAMNWGWGKDSDAPPDGDVYMYGGLDQEVQSNRIDFANATVTLALMDDLIDRIRSRGVTKDPLMFQMSSAMQSKVSSLEGRLRRESPAVDVKGGFRLPSYRGIPISESSYLKPSSTMTTVTAADDATAGGLVATKTYRFKIAPITTYGEQAASAEVSHTLGGGITSVKLSFTAFPDARLYKVYRTVDGGGAGTQVLSFVAPAKTYDSDGTVTGAVAFVIDTIADAALGTDVPIALTDEVISLTNLSSNNGTELVDLPEKEGDALTKLIRFIELAKTRSAKDYILESFQAYIIKGEIYCSLARRVKSS